MANASDWANAAGGIPIGLIEGYNYGQKAQRDEEKALEEIKQAKTLNELLGFKSGEYMSPEEAATRRAESDYRRAGAELGSFQTGVSLEGGRANRDLLVGGVGAQIRTGVTKAGTAEREATLESDLFGKRADITRALVEGDWSRIDLNKLIADATARGKLGEAQSIERKWSEDALQSGALDIIRVAAGKKPPGSPLYDVLFQSWTDATTDQQRALVDAQMRRVDQDDLGKIGNVSDANKWLARPGRQTKSHAYIEGNTVVVAPLIELPNGQTVVDDRPGQTQKFGSWEEFKRQYGTSIPRGTSPTGSRAASAGPTVAGVAAQVSGVPQAGEGAPTTARDIVTSAGVPPPQGGSGTPQAVGVAPAPTATSAPLAYPRMSQIGGGAAPKPGAPALGVGINQEFGITRAQPPRVPTTFPEQNVELNKILADLRDLPSSASSADEAKSIDLRNAIRQLQDRGQPIDQKLFERIRSAAETLPKSRDVKNPLTALGQWIGQNIPQQEPTPAEQLIPALPGQQSASGSIRR